MESAAESVEAAASIVLGTKQRIVDLRRHFEETSEKVAQRRSELEQLIIQFKQKSGKSTQTVLRLSRRF
jgi:uncharacterized protein Yka (UPF0111/DUF47 family)